VPAVAAEADTAEIAVPADTAQIAANTVPNTLVLMFFFMMIFLLYK
jgi:hypothetical protein